MTALTRALPGSRRAAVRRPAAPWPLLGVGLLVAALAALPLVYLAIRAAGVDGDGVAFLVRPRTLTAIAGTLALGLAVGVGTVCIGVPVAWLTTRTDLPARRVWSVLTIVPLALPSYVVGFAYLATFGPRGALQQLLAPLGVERLPSFGGFVGAAFVLTIVAYPYVVLATRAALLRVDPALEDAARSLGDDRRAVLRRVTIPLLVPAIAAGALLAVLYALADFGAVALLQFESLARAIQLQLSSSFDRSLAALLAIVLVGLTVLVTWGEGRLRGRSVLASRRLSVRPMAIVPLGAWRWPATAFLAAVVILGLVVPVATIGWWLLRGVLNGEPLRFVVELAAQTFGLGLGAAVLAVLVAVPVALLGARFPSRVARTIESVVLGGYALPGIVVALAMVFLATRTLPFLYQTLALLMAVYAVRFAAQTIGGIRAALATTGRRPEEVARTLGDGALGAFVRVTVPAVRPAMLAGGTLVLLTVVKELPLALLLAPTGFETLATEVWDAASSGFYARAAAPAALLLVVSGLTVLGLVRAEGRAR